MYKRQFLRSLNDWEEESILNFLALLASAKVAPVGDDMMIWPHDSKRKFTIKSFYRVVCEGSSNIDFLVDAMWRSKVPTKAWFLAWATTKGKVHTEDMLKRRNFNLASRCSMCRQEEETIDHLFIHCRCVSGPWHVSFSLLGINWVQPYPISDSLEEKDEEMLALGNLEDNSVGHVVEYLEGEESTDFRGEGWSYQEFKLYFLRTLYSWSLVLDDGTNLNLFNFVDKIIKESKRA